MRILHPLFLVAVTALLLLGTSAASAASKKNVLILNSYHQGYKWTDDQLKGILESLDPDKNDCSFFVEFMGTKWIHGPVYSATLRSLYSTKYGQTRFDLIIATDDDALDFLLLYRDDIFGEVPVVFCGINWFDPQRLADRRNYTGVNEVADIGATIDLMLMLHPGTRTIDIVTDRTTTGRIVENKLLELIPRYSDRVGLQLVPDMPAGDLIAHIASLPTDHLVLLTVYQQDRDGAYIDFFEVPGEMARRSRVPIYGLWDFHLGRGIVGGLLTSGYAQGRTAGRLARRILDGEAAETIPIVMNGPNRYRFDFTQMQRFALRPEDLPEGSDVISLPPSFYRVNRTLIWGLALGLTAMCIAVVVLLVNIHRRGIAETALRDSEERFHTLVDNLPLGVFRRTPGAEGRFIQINPAMAAMFGFASMAEMMAVPVSSLAAGDRGSQSSLHEPRPGGDLTGREIRMRRKDGTTFWVAITTQAHHDHAGQINWIDGTCEDITGRKQLEMQLRHTQKMEAMGTLTGGIAHDFNNILTAIIGYSSLLQMRIDDADPRRAQVDEILRSSQRAAALTRSLLAFSRTQEMETGPLDINDCIRQFRSFLSRIIGEDVELVTSLADTPLMVLADRGQIEQVLMNLATNGRDAMEQGGTLHIATRDLEIDGEEAARMTLPPGRYVEITVSDTGTGMDETTRQRIFEPFFTTKETGRGTGLGLSILYGIIRQHHGGIDVTSEMDRGTTFRIFLPVTTAVAATGVDHGAMPPGGDETILLIEDDEVLRRLEKGILEQFGYQVIEAEDGEEGLLLYQAYGGRIDCLLLDVIMPRKNGREVFEEIRQLRPDIKALFTSGYTADIIHRQGIIEQHLDFLAKPATPTELLKKLREVLDRTG